MNGSRQSFLFVFPTATLGGAERVMFNLITYLLREGHQVTVYVMSRGIQPGWEGISSFPNARMIVRDYPSEKTSLPMFFVSMIGLSVSGRFDVVFSSHTHVNAVLSLLRKLVLIRCRVMVARESTFIFERFFGARRLIFRFLYRVMYGAQDLLVCQTEKMRASLLGSLGYCPARRAVVIPNPVNLENIEAMRSVPLPAGLPFSLNVVACGRFVEIKGFDKLVDAFAAIACEFPMVGLVLIGDGPCDEALRRQVIDCGLEGRVHFAGRQENPINWLARADVGVISSLKEGFPNVLLEMMAAGTRAIVSTPCTDGLDDIPGILVLREASVDAIADGLRGVLGCPEDRSAAYARYVAECRSVSAFWREVEVAVSR